MKIYNVNESQPKKNTVVLLTFINDEDKIKTTTANYNHDKERWQWHDSAQTLETTPLFWCYLPDLTKKKIVLKRNKPNQ